MAHQWFLSKEAVGALCRAVALDVQVGVPTVSAIVLGLGVAALATYATSLIRRGVGAGICVMGEEETSIALAILRI